MRHKRRYFNRLDRNGARRTQQPRNAVDDATLYIYDEISWWGVTAESFVKDLNAIDADAIDVRINSPGGNVFDGITIAEAIRRHGARVTVHVDGIAASIASVIAVAGDEIRIANGGFIMIHDPWSLVIGNADDMRKEAEVLDKIGDSIAGEYARRTGLDRGDILDMMDAETWLNAEEAVGKGFADAISGDEPAQANWDLSIFNNVPSPLRNGIGRRNGDKKPTERELERILRDAGLSRTEAKAVISSGYKAIRRDAGDDITAALRGLLETINHCIQGE